MQYLELPNKKVIQVAEGVSYEDALNLAKKRFPKLYADTSKAEEGFIPSFMSGIEGLKSSLSTATAPLFGTSDADTRQQYARSQALQSEIAKAPSFEDVKKAHTDYGIFGGAKPEERGSLSSLLGLWRGQFAESLPQMGATLGGARLGAMAGSAVAPGIGTVIGGGLGALAASIPNFTGTNVERNIAEQEQSGKKEPLEYGKALATAVPQAALDVASQFFILGKLGVGKPIVDSLTNIAEKFGFKAAEDQLVKVANRKVATALAGGAAKGMAIEIPTEIAQQVLERAQANLPLLDKSAMDEYIATGVGVAGPGGAFGAYGGYSARSSARTQVAEQEEAKQAAERVKRNAEAQAQTEAEEERKKTDPRYAQGLFQERAPLMQRMEEINSIIKAGGKDLDPTDKNTLSEERKTIGRRLFEINSELKNIGAKTPGKKTLQQVKDELDAKTQIVDEEGNVIKTPQQALQEQEENEADYYDKQDEAAKLFREKAAVEQEKTAVAQEKAKAEEEKARVAGTAEFAKSYEEGEEQRDTLLKQALEREQKRRADVAGADIGAQRAETMLTQARLKGVLFGRDNTLTPEQRATVGAGERTTQEEASTAEPTYNENGEPLKLDTAAKKSVLTKLDNGVLDRLGQQVLGVTGLKGIQHQLTDVPQAQAALPAIRKRINALQDEKDKFYSTDVDLLTPEGQLTDIGDRAMAVEAQLMELKKLEKRGQATLDDEYTKQTLEGTVDRALDTYMTAQQTRSEVIDRDQPREVQEAKIDEELGTQQTVFDELRIALNDIRSGNYLGSKRSTEQTQRRETQRLVRREAGLPEEDLDVSESAKPKAQLEKEIETAKNEYANSVVRQVEHHRATRDRAALTPEEAQSLFYDVYGRLDEMAFRGLAPKVKKEAVLVTPAQMRGNKLVSGAKYEYRDVRTPEEKPYGSYSEATGAPRLEREESERGMGQFQYEKGPQESTFTPAQIVEDLGVVREKIAKTKYAAMNKRTAPAKGVKGPVSAAEQGELFGTVAGREFTLESAKEEKTPEADRAGRTAYQKAEIEAKKRGLSEEKTKAFAEDAYKTAAAGTPQYVERVLRKLAPILDNPNLLTRVKVVLTNARNALESGTGSTKLAEAVNEQIRRIETGIDQPFKNFVRPGMRQGNVLSEINAELNNKIPTEEAGQKEIFKPDEKVQGAIRSSAQAFQKFLSSKTVQKLRASIAKTKGVFTKYRAELQIFKQIRKIQNQLEQVRETYWAVNLPPKPDKDKLTRRLEDIENSTGKNYSDEQRFKDKEAALLAYQRDMDYYFSFYDIDKRKAALKKYTVEFSDRLSALTAQLPKSKASEIEARTGARDEARNAVTTAVRKAVAERDARFWDKINKNLLNWTASKEAYTKELKELETKKSAAILAFEPSTRFDGYIDLLNKQISVLDKNIKEYYDDVINDGDNATRIAEVYANKDVQEAFKRSNDMETALNEAKGIAEKWLPRKVPQPIVKTVTTKEGKEQTYTVGFSDRFWQMLDKASNEVKAQRVEIAKDKETIEAQKEAYIKDKREREERFNTFFGLPVMRRTVETLEGVSPRTGEKVILKDKRGKTGKPLQIKRITKVGAQETEQERKDRLAREGVKAATQGVERRELLQKSKENKTTLPGIGDITQGVSVTDMDAIIKDLTKQLSSKSLSKKQRELVRNSLREWSGLRNAERTLLAEGDKSGKALAKAKLRTSGAKKEKEAQATAVKARRDEQKQEPYSLEERLSLADFNKANDPFFESRGEEPVGEASTKKSVYADLKKAFKTDVENRVTVYQTVAEARAAHPQLKKDINDDTRGFVFFDEAFLIAENIEKGKALSVLLHELGVHIGFRNLFNEKEFDALVNVVRQWAARKDNSIEARVGRAAMDRVKEAKVPAYQMDEELLAYAVEEAVSAGVNPSGVGPSGAIRAWFSRIVKGFREALIALRLAPDTLTAQNVVDFAYGAANIELETEISREINLIAKDVFNEPLTELSTKPSWNAELSSDQEKLISIGEFGPVKNAYIRMSTIVDLDLNRIDVKIYVVDRDILTDSEAPIEGAFVDIFKATLLDPERRNSTLKLSTMGVPGFSTYVLDKYKNYITEENGYYKITPGIVGNATVAKIWRTLRNEIVASGFVDTGTTLSFFRATSVKADTDAANRIYDSKYIANFSRGEPQLQDVKTDEIFFSRGKAKMPAGFEAVQEFADAAISADKTWLEKVKSQPWAQTALGIKIAKFDRIAAFEELADKMIKAGNGNQAMQMMYDLQGLSDVMSMASASAYDGALVRVKDPNRPGEYRYQASGGASLRSTDKLLKPLLNQGFTPESASNLFTAYMVTLRGKSVGYEKLNFSDDVQKMIKDVIPNIQANNEVLDILNKAREEYNEYNKGQIEFLESSGQISSKIAQEMRSKKDYIPYYRDVQGSLKLFIGDMNPVTLGDLKHQKHLQKLVGGEQKILNYFDSSMQNTMILTDLALTNFAKRNTITALNTMGLLQPIGGTKGPTIRGGNGPENANVIRFKDNGDDKHVVVNTEGTPYEYIPTELLIKGLEGVPFVLPGMVKMLGAPAQWLRKGITLNPLYPYYQLVKDSMAMGATRGVGYSNTLNVLKGIKSYINNEKLIKELQSRGVIQQREMFSGSTEDSTINRRRIVGGESGFQQFLAGQEGRAIKADGAVRATLYDAYIKQGLSERDAEYMIRKAMPYSRRGLDPSLRYLSHMIPFFNAQIVGLYSLYQSFRGQGPMSEKLQIKKKLFAAGMNMALGTLIYAALVSGEEWYENMPIETRLRNWLIKVPGVKEPVAVPIPFEFGIIFKSFFEATYMGMFKDTPEGTQVAKAFRKQLLGAVPGGTVDVDAVPLIGAVPMPLPTAAMPLLEVAFNKSAYTGAPIETRQDLEKIPEERFRDTTSELAKTLGKTAGISPLQIDSLIRGYTGTVGPAVIALIDAFTAPASTTGAKPEKMLSKTPLLSQIFKPVDGGAIINMAIETLNDAAQIENTYKSMLNEGREAEAEKFLAKNISVIERGPASLAGKLRQQLGEFKKAETAVKMDQTMNAKQKRDELDELRSYKIQLGKDYMQAFRSGA